MQIRNECLSCRHGVAVFDMSYFGKFYLTGPDARKAADWLFTADVNKKPGQSDWKKKKQSHTNVQTQADGRKDWQSEEGSFTICKERLNKMQAREGKLLLPQKLK